MRLYSICVHILLSTCTNIPRTVYIHRTHFSDAPHLSLNTALKIKLSLAIRSHSTPSRLISDLSVITNGSRLPRLVESLKVEAVEAPVEQRAEASLVKVLCVVQTALGLIVVGANGSGPASFASPDLRCFFAAAGHFLDVCGGLEHVVEVDVTAEMLVYYSFLVCNV